MGAFPQWRVPAGGRAWPQGGWCGTDGGQQGHLHLRQLPGDQSEKAKLDLFTEVAERAAAQATETPDDPNAWYLQAYALGRYGQGISVAKALAQGLGHRVKEALEKTIRLPATNTRMPALRLGAFHAEVIDKVGSLIGGMTYGAKKDTGLKLFQQALKLNPGSAIGDGGVRQWAGHAGRRHDA